MVNISSSFKTSLTGGITEDTHWCMWHITDLLTY